jgi:hypothetical protein
LQQISTAKSVCIDNYYCAVGFDGGAGESPTKCVSFPPIREIRALPALTTFFVRDRGSIVNTVVSYDSNVKKMRRIFQLPQAVDCGAEVPALVMGGHKDEEASRRNTLRAADRLVICRYQRTENRKKNDVYR